MDRSHRRTISREYFSQERLAEHHFRSFNAFLERGMQDVVDEKETIDTDIGDKEGEEPVHVELGDDVGEVTDVVGMGVSHHEGVHVVDVFAGRADDVELVAGVDEHCALAVHEEDVARERADAACKVDDHTLGSATGGFCVSLHAHTT